MNNKPVKSPPKIQIERFMQCVLGVGVNQDRNFHFYVLLNWNSLCLNESIGAHMLVLWTYEFRVYCRVWISRAVPVEYAGVTNSDEECPLRLLIRIFLGQPNCSNW